MHSELITFYVPGGILLLTCAIAVYNTLTITKLANRPYPLARMPLVSILVPVRNEENNIRDLLLSILSQTYTEYEVIVLDDQSEDETYLRAREVASRSGRITIVRGKPLPPGWVGKNWACLQLSELARGHLYLFIDADVRLSSYALESALSTMFKAKVAMLSCFPTQHMSSPGAWLAVPLMNWILLSFLPLSLVTTTAHLSLAAANGQFILCDKNTYDAVGGHKALADEIVEDMAFARRLKQKGFRIMGALGHEAVSCTMYGSFKDAFRGFSKNFFPACNVSAPAFLCMLGTLAFVFLTPFILVVLNPLYLWLVLLILLERIIIARLSLQNPLITILLHPLQMLSMVVIGTHSLYWSLSGKTIWKGRRI